MNRSLRATAVLVIALCPAMLPAQQPSASDADAVLAPGNTLELDQPAPSRSRYGRARYNDHLHNADGSSKYEFNIGFGLTAPVGNAHHYLQSYYALQVGGGRDFNKRFGILLEYDYDHFGFNSQTLTAQLSLYDIATPPGSPYYVSSLDGRTRAWSFTLNPHYNVFAGEQWGAYVVAGAGFFHKVASFSIPTSGSAYSPYLGGVYEYTDNETIDKYSSNAPGFNGGFGVTRKLSRFASERFYAEARYNATLNSQRIGLTAQNINTPFGQSYTGSNFYPANSNRTAWLTIVAGIRF